MKKIKFFIGMLCLMAVCLFLPKTNEVKAASNPSINVAMDSSSANPGDTVNVTVTFTGPTDVDGATWGAIEFYLYLTNPDNFTLGNITIDDDFSGYVNMSSSEFDQNNDLLISLNFAIGVDKSLAVSTATPFVVNIPFTVLEVPVNNDPIDLIVSNDVDSEYEGFHSILISTSEEYYEYYTVEGTIDCPAVNTSVEVAAASSVAELDYLKIDDTEYTSTDAINSILASGITVEPTQESVTIVAKAKERGTISSVTGPGTVSGTETYTIALDEAGTESEIKINVTSQNTANTVPYTLNVTRKPFTVNTLDSLQINLEQNQKGVAKLDKNFASETNNYSLSLPEGATKLLINPTVTANVNIKSVTINGSNAISGSNNEVNIEGVDTITIIVTPQDDNAEARTYTIELERKSDDTSLKSELTVNAIKNGNSSGTISVIKVDDSYTQNIDFKDADGFKVNATPNDSKASLVFNVTDGIASFTSIYNETKTVTATVTSESGIERVYTVTITRLVDSDNTLDTLEFMVDGTDYVPTDWQSKDIINIEIPDNVTTLTGTISATATSDNATIISGLNPDTITLPTGNDKISHQIIVKAANEEEKTYQLYIYREGAGLSANNKITKIQVLDEDEHDYIEFEEGDVFYEVTLPYNISTITVSVVTEDSSATVTGAKPYQFTYGQERTIIVYATAANTEKGQEYTIKIKRTPADTNAYLTDLKVDGVTVEGFDEETTEYTIRVEHNVASVKLDATPYTLATLASDLSSAKPLSIGNNPFTITVIAQDGSTTKHYNLSIYRAEDKNTITDINISNTNYEFKKDITTPEAIQVPYSIKTVEFEVLTDATYGTISVFGTQTLSVGINKFKVYVVSEYDKYTNPNSTGTVYEIVINRAEPDDNTNLKSLTVEIKGENKIDFKKEITVYTMPNVDSTVTSVYISAVPEADTSTVTKIGEITLPTEIENGNTVILIVTVTAESGRTQEYKIYVSRGAVELDNNNDITNIVISANDIVYFDDFNSALTEYTNTTTIPHNVESVYVSVTTPSGAQSTVTGSGWYHFNNSTSITVIVYATAADGKKGVEYKITLTKGIAQSDASLEFIKVDGTIIEGFSSNIYEYSMHVNNSVSTVDITYQAKLDTTKVEILLAGDVKDGIGIELQPGGQNIIALIATAEDGTIKVYTINIVRSAADGILSELYIDGVLFHAENDTETSVYYSEDVTTYYATVSFNYETIEIMAAASDTTMEIRGLGIKTLEVGIQKFQIDAIPVNGNVTTYNIIVVRKAATTDNTNIIEFKIDELAGFVNDYSNDINIYDYETYKYTVSSVTKKLSFNVDFGLGEFMVSPVIEEIGNDLKYGMNIVLFKITASNGVSQRVIAVEVYRTELEATSAKINEIEGFATDFNNDTLSYSYTVANEVDKLNIEFTLNEETASYEVSNTELTAGQNNVIEVKFKNGDEVVKVIKINVFRQATETDTPIVGPVSKLPMVACATISGAALFILLLAFILVIRKKRG